MANIFDKVSSLGMDRTLVLNSREGLVYPLPFSDWNTIKIGAYISFTAPSDNDIAIPEYTSSRITITGPSERIYFGVKNNNKHFPGVHQETFCGICSTKSESYIRQAHGLYMPYFGLGEDNNGMYATSASLYPCVIKRSGAIEEADPTPHIWTWGYDGGYEFATQNAYAMGFGLMVKVLNKGTSNQTIMIARNTTLMGSSSQHISDTSGSALRDAIINSTYGAVCTLPWNESGVPFDLPSAIFMYIPAPNFRMRIHNIGVIKTN